MTRPVKTISGTTPSDRTAGSGQADPRVDARRRVIVERAQPEIDGGRYPIKRTPGESVRVTVDLFADGHDLLAGALKYRRRPAGRPSACALRADPAPLNDIPLMDLGNDSWGASFVVTELGEYEYTVEAWIDRFGSWLTGLLATFAAQQDVASELLEGAALVQSAVRLKPDTTDDATPRNGSQAYVVSGFSRTEEDLRLLAIADTLRGRLPQVARVSAARDPTLRTLMSARADRSSATTYDKALRVRVDPPRARFGAWYEMFPRSCTTDAARPGTLRDVEAQLPRIANLGFDVLYLPPVHPIGHTHRKGRNNSLRPAATDPGSPWAIGAETGGHTAIDPGLGTLADFDRLVALAGRLGLDVALDIAFQTSPDHPWVREHPEWFRHRPDGSIKYAENPPKKYQDIYPIDFETAEWQSLWAALRGVFAFWIAHGVRIFRVDNPHTKSFRFWEWAIADITRQHPEVIFLAEAFTRPKVMRHLAKAGFTQSYTYFTWRNSAHDLREYMTELTTTELAEYMRPNFFANTPDILPEYLQSGGRPAFAVRFILAATLAASYGIYSGFELCENLPARPGSEEYLDSDKYQVRPRDWSQAARFNELIARVNHIRRQHPALQFNDGLRFHDADNGALLWFSKHTPGPRRGTRPAADHVFVVANTDPHWLQHGWIRMPIEDLGIAPRQPYVVEDLLDGARYTWRGDWNYVRLNPSERVAHIFVVRP